MFWTSWLLLMRLVVQITSVEESRKNLEFEAVGADQVVEWRRVISIKTGFK
jgi:hypothetical protein